MLINEIVKSFLNTQQKDPGSSTVKDANMLVDLTNSDVYPNTGSFFDDNEFTGGLFGKSEVSNILFKQKEKIMKYRNLAATSDVSDAIDEIVNEIIFTYDDEIPIKISVNVDNDKLVTAISEKFNKIIKLTRAKKNIFQIVKRSYIDGQIIMHCTYDSKNTNSGIQSIQMIEPSMLYYDQKISAYKYMSEDKVNIMAKKTTESYSHEELVREDFGLYDGKINLSYLEYAIKPANILKTLEDLLVPLRFSRSISRRVFNVDIGDLPNKRGLEVMRDYQAKFKYKKFYNNDTGEVTNQQHITSMVEDYWFANRSGGKGTTVDVLDETGNLGELNDILYFSKKLYKSLNIPSSRINVNPEADNEYDYSSTRVTQEDMKFFMFTSRLRQVYSSLFKELLKREVVSCGTMTNDEWEDNEDSINISFTSENKFIEKMKTETFMSKMDIYATASEYQGKLFSVKRLLKDVFRMTEEETIEEFREIAKERKDPLYAEFYKEEGDGF